MLKFDKYQDNLKYDEQYVYSYNTKVAKIENEYLIELERYSVTTSKHIKYAAIELNLILIRL